MICVKFCAPTRQLTNGKFLLLRVLELGPELPERVVDVHVLGERLAVHAVRAASRLRADLLQLGGGEALLLSNMGTYAFSGAEIP